MNISLTNKKLGKFVPSVNLPPIITCRENVPCAKGCYATKGNYNYDNVKKPRFENLNEFNQNPTKYFQEIIDFLNNGDVIYKFFRWHDSGDIVNEIYLEGMIKVAKACKQTKFLAFTKKFELINEYLNKGNKIPNNLQIMFSAWDKEFKIENPYNFPVYYVYFKNKEKNPIIPKSASTCSGSCKECKTCWFAKAKQAIKCNQH